MIFKSTFIATAVAASALFLGGTTSSEARPRISFSVDTGGYHSGHGYNRGGYQRGYSPRRPVYYNGYRESYRGGYSRRPSYRGSGYGYRGSNCR